MSDKTYLEENLGYITCSKIKAFKKSREAYKVAYIDWIQTEDTPIYFILWQALDDLVSTSMEEFEQKYLILEPRKRKKTDEDRIQLTNSDWNRVLKMFEELKRQPLFDLDGEYQKQHTMIAQFKHLKLKGTFDRYNKDKKIIRDTKSTSNISSFEASIRWDDTFSYIYQWAYYALLAYIEDKVECDFILDVVDKTDIPKYNSFKIPFDTLKDYFPLIKDDLNELIKAEEDWNYTDEDRQSALDSPYYKHLSSSIQKDFITII